MKLAMLVDSVMTIIYCLIFFFVAAVLPQYHVPMQRFTDIAIFFSNLKLAAEGYFFFNKKRDFFFIGL